MSMNPSSLAPWVKSVPRGWTVKRLKYTVKLINEKVDPVESDLPYICAYVQHNITLNIEK